MSNLLANNTTPSYITVNRCKVYSIDVKNIDIIDVKDINNNKFKSFRYNLNDIFYYFVIDDIQTQWANDLNSIGYFESPSVMLPTVTVSTAYSKADKTTSVNISSTLGAFLFNEEGINIAFQQDVCYLCIKYYGIASDTTGSTSNLKYSYFEDRNDNLFFGARIPNYGSITVQRIDLAVCSSSQATSITVYNSNNIAFSAFKYLVNGTNYYYVLDGIHSNWTNNLSSIGYKDYVELLFGFKWNEDETGLYSVTDLSNDYYWGRVLSQEDKDLLIDMGIWYNTSYKYGTPVYDSTQYSYSVVGIYSDRGETVASGHNLSLCEIRAYSSANNIGLYYNGTSNEAVMTWKCRITRNQ